MRNTSKTINRISIVCACIGFLVYSAPLFGQEESCRTDSEFTFPVQAKNRITSKICIERKVYKLIYKINKRALSVVVPKMEKTIIEHIPIGLEPEKVGAEEDFYFLPLSLQPYVNKGEILYLSARRSTGGNGMGYCGSGIEKHLNILSTKENPPRLIGNHLIASCLYSIELAGSDLEAPNPLSAFLVLNGNLLINFINYRRRGSMAAKLSGNHLNLIPMLNKNQGISE